MNPFVHYIAKKPASDCPACDHQIPMIDTLSWGGRIVNMVPKPFLCHGHIVAHSDLAAMGGVFHKVSLDGGQAKISWGIAKASGHALVRRIRLVFGVGTKYDPDFSIEGQMCIPDRNMLVRIVSVAWLREAEMIRKSTGRGYCHRRLQIRCYQCERWVCPDHFYSQHLDSAACKRNQAA